MGPLANCRGHRRDPSYARVRLHTLGPKLATAGSAIAGLVLFVPQRIGRQDFEELVASSIGVHGLATAATVWVTAALGIAYALAAQCSLLPER